MYINTDNKFRISIIMSILWVMFAIWVAQPWIVDLSSYIGVVMSYVIIYGIAVFPGFMNAFLIASLMLDKRPKIDKTISHYPPLSIVIAVYNEQDSISDTLESILRQRYPSDIRIYVIDDGSTDDTVSIVQQQYGTVDCIELVALGVNKGKAAALNEGLKLVKTDLFITIDGDSYLYKDSLCNLVARYLSDPPSAAIVGAVLVRNSRKNLVTKVQEWDYFHGISAIKRIQSLYQGTLVAQGAYSLYETEIIRSVGGWKNVVGEDIVLTWELLERGYRVGYAENACSFTNAPETWKQFLRQRQRWSRGIIEAFKNSWGVLFVKRKSTIFIWWNLLFVYMDLIYTFAFIPGIVLALFGIYAIVGPMTLLVLPLAMLVNYIMYWRSSEMFREQGLRVRRNYVGFVFYSLMYSLVLQPACTLGYIKEIFSLGKKTWGTK